MPVPLRYNLRSLRRRRVSAAMTVAGVALVVFVFMSLMALVEGLRGAFVDTGDPRNVMVIRKGSLAEQLSVVPRDAYQALRFLPEIAATSDGSALASPEAILTFTIPRDDGRDANVSMRGVMPQAFQVHSQVHVVAGRAFEPGKGEAIVGEPVTGEHGNLRLGGTFKFARREWKVVGVFRAGGATFESEIWADLDGVLNDGKYRDVYSSVVLRLRNPADMPAVTARIESDKRFSMRAEDEPTYYRSQAGSTEPVRALVMFVTLLMGIGAVFGALNTMYAAVAGRIREIATLRALGFSNRSVLAGFVVEGLVQTLLGGAIGCALSFLVDGQGGSSMNAWSYTSVQFKLRVTPALLGYGLTFAALIGAIGAALPARSALRQRVTDSLRA